MKHTKRNFIIVLIISLVVMFFVFKHDYKNIIAMFSDISYRWLILAIVIMALYHLLDAYFIHYYCKMTNKKYTFWNSVEVEQTGTFVNSITPFASGGQVVQVLVLAKQKIDTKQSASMLMLSFISWQIVLVVFGAIVLIFYYTHFLAVYQAIFSLVILGFLVHVGVIVGLFLMAFSKKFHYFIFAKIIPFLGKLKILKNVEQKKESTQVWLKLFRDEFNILLLHKDLMIRRFVIDTLKIFTLYSIPFFAAKALNMDMGWSELKLIIILTAFVYMFAAFIPSPGAAGGTEGTFVILFAPLLGPATASVMLLWRFLTYYLTMLVSFIIFASIKEMKK